MRITMFRMEQAGHGMQFLAISCQDLYTRPSCGRMRTHMSKSRLSCSGQSRARRCTWTSSASATRPT